MGGVLESIRSEFGGFARGGALAGDRTTREADFESFLKLKRGTASPEDLARRSAEEFVAQALVLPVLKGLREASEAAPPFAPGAYEKNIGSLHDMEIASRLVRSQRFPIVDAVARNLLMKSGMDPDGADGSEHGGSNNDADAAAKRPGNSEGRAPVAAD